MSRISSFIDFVLGGAKGPGLFFVVPCVDNFVKVDLRTTTFNVPPQEVPYLTIVYFIFNDFLRF